MDSSKRRAVFLARAVATLAMAALLAACGSTPDPQPSSGARAAPETSDLTFQAVAAADWAWIYLARDAGIFTKNGLNVKIVEVAPATVPAALTRDSIQAASTVGTCTRARGEGLPVVNVGVAGIRASHVLLARQGITSVSNLAGKTVIAQAAQSSPTVRLRNALAKASVADSATILNIASSDAQVAAFRAGQGDAIYEPADIAAKLASLVPGSQIIMTSAEGGPAVPNTGICVTEKFRDANPRAIQALITSMVESVQLFLSADANTVSMVGKALNLTDAQAKQTIDTVQNDFITYPVASEQMLANLANQESASQKKTVGTSDIAKAYDFSIANEVVSKLKLVKPKDPELGY